MNAKHIIGLPVSPSVHLDHDIKKVDEIQLTFGGGMGGSSVKEYGTITDRDGATIFFTNFLGQKMQLNSRFIVWIKPKKLLTAKVDISGWAKIRIDGVKKLAPTDTMIRTIFKIIDTTDTVQFNENFDNNDNKNVVHTLDEIIRK